MNKKGFTLVELLATIVVLIIIIGIATTSALSISARTKKRMYETKVGLILDAAKLYAQDHMDKVVDSESSCSSATTTKGLVTVLTLYNDGKLKKDGDNIKVQDPVTGNDMTTNNNLTICMYKKNNRVNVKLKNCLTWKANGAELKKYCS